MKTGQTPVTATTRIDPRLQRILDHVWGPTGSALLHVLVLFLLLQMAIRQPPPAGPEITALVEEMHLADLDELDPTWDRPPPDVDVFVPPADSPPQAEPAAMSDDPSPPPANLPEPLDTTSVLKLAGLNPGVTASMRRSALAVSNHSRTDTEDCVVRSLEWLRDRQHDDGSWSGDGAARNPAAMTGLALLCFLAHGDTPAKSERYGPAVDRAIRWLAARQKSDGAFDDNAYANAIATYAISEAYFLTRIPSLRVAMETALGRIVAGQQDTGAFTYGYAKNGRRDTSVAGWQIQALKAGFVAGADVSGLTDALRRSADAIRANHEPSTGRFLYAPEPGKAEGSRPTLACTGIGVLSLQMLGLDGSREVESGLRALEEHKPDYRAPEGTGRPLYAWYYVTQAMFRAGRGAWHRWNDAFAKTMAAAQNRDGSWSPAGAEEADLGPVYGTTFSALSLMVYYRTLGTYTPAAAGSPAPGAIAQPDDIPVIVL